MDKVIKTNCPFTLTEYRELIRLAKTKYPFIGYSEYTEHSSFILWRHDVEYVIEQMDVLAKIDYEEGIKSTLFVQLHCNWYNFWDKENTGIFRKWVKWGHDIGLHFDFGFFGMDVMNELEEIIDYEKKFIERTLDTKVDSFAFHNPNPEILKLNGNYSGLINTYNEDFFSGNITYVSDSNGRWRERTIRDVIEDNSVSKVQVNTHDTWWTNERIPQIEKLERAFRNEAERKILDYRNTALIVVDSII